MKNAYLLCHVHFIHDHCIQYIESSQVPNKNCTIYDTLHDGILLNPVTQKNCVRGKLLMLERQVPHESFLYLKS